MELKLKPRKVFKAGKYSIFLTLPSEWVNHHRINGGDSVFLKIKDDGSLEIKPKEKNEEII